MYAFDVSMPSMHASTPFSRFIAASRLRPECCFWHGQIRGFAA
jgi:hypothetical protein